MQTRSSRGLVESVLLVAAAACALGSTGVVAKPLYGLGLDWLTILSWRFALAAVLCWTFFVVAKRRARVHHPSRRRALLLLLLGGLHAADAASYFAAIETLDVSIAILILYLYPALVAILSIRGGRTLRGRKAWAALAVSLVGVALAVGRGASSIEAPFPGLVLAFGAAGFVAAWVMLTARLSREGAALINPDTRERRSDDMTEVHDDVVTNLALMTTGSAIVCVLALGITGRPAMPAVPLVSWFGVTYIAVVGTIFAVYAFYTGTRRLGAANAALVSTVEPVFTIGLAAVVLGELITPVQLLGAALVVLGVLIAVTSLERQQEPSSLTLAGVPTDNEQAVH